MEAGMTVTMGVRKAYFRLLADLSELAAENKTVDEQNFQSIDQREPLIRVKSEFAGRYEKMPSGFHHQIPANLVMFTMLILFIYGGTTLVEEIKHGLLKRIKVAPVTSRQIFLGKWTGVTLIGILQSAILITFGRLFRRHAI